MGTEAEQLLSRLPDPDSVDQVRDEALRVLGRCVPPSQTTGIETGLVIGHIQSGKTMSFTVVTALARDNNYQMAIVVTGTSRNLFNQSTQRLKDDLRLATRADHAWRFFENPRATPDIRQSLRDTFADWCDPTVPAAHRQMVLITVMKQGDHLDDLTAMLHELDLADVPTLVIDDEADQAGLNNRVNRGEQSATYHRLLALRAELPHHTLLQYTATPQAPLLINIIDVLSPAFAELLTPGQAYVGGEDFFFHNPPLARVIPPAHIPSATNPLHEPPDSLLEAMRVFFLGVATGYSDAGPTTGNRSMMVHPSRETMSHGEYVHWVRQTKARWERTLSLPDDDPDRRDLLEQFRSAHADLLATVAGLPAFEQLITRLPRAIRLTEVHEVNRRLPGIDTEVRFENGYAHIIVGGQLLDRGVTVRGLTVTYMPRGRGVGNADTVQQRARFFGYKRDYLGFCRIYLETGALQVFQAYVQHEINIRDQLDRHRRTGRPLSHWKRAFFLDPALRPTRASVIDVGFNRVSLADRWFDPKAPHASLEAIVENRRIRDEFVAGLHFVPNEGDPRRTQFARHLVDHDVSLGTAYERLLVPLRVTSPADSDRFFALRLQIEDYLEDHRDALCTVYLMAEGRERGRALTDSGEVDQLFQGADQDRTVYAGDRSLHTPGRLTIQIHNLRVPRTGPPVAIDVPAIAVWVPRVMAAHVVVQPQGGDD